MDTIVQVEGLRKTYGALAAVDGVSFEVREGEIFGMVGPNGAGKTTTIECLEGLRKPDSGMVRVLGVDPQLEGQALCLRTGMQLQQSNLPDRMKVWEALDLYASFYPKAVDWKELLLRLGLDEKRNTPFAKLSGGQKQRLFIALALLPDPQLVFLDELTTGLDPQARHAIWDLVRDVRTRGKSVILSTHFMEEAEKLCDRIAILDHGKIVALDTPANLIHSLDAEERVVFSVDGPLPATFEKSLSGAVRLEVQGGQVIIHAANGCKGPAKGSGNGLVSEVVSQLGGQGIQFHDLRTEQPDLEDVFLSLTGRDLRE
ncbi:MAG TPA: ABC transporter ATP-binding protein [Anaerolineales bacterium]|nr:ABC transporter ATP-binding protein [Anaerolineales bacterium]